MPELSIKYTINKWYRPNDKEQNVRAWVYQRYRDMKESPERKRVEREWDAADKAWEAHREPKDYNDWQSNYYIPLTTSVVEAIVAEYIDQQQRPLILPRSREDTPKAMVMNTLFEYTWDVGDGDLQLLDVFKDGLIKGTSFAQEFYYKDRRIIQDILNFESMTNEKKRSKFKTKEKEVFEFDDTYMEWVSGWDVFFDEKAYDINRGTRKARDCVRRYVMNIRDARRFFSGPVWDPLGNMQYVKPGGDTQYYQYYKPDQDINHTEDVEVLWYWARSPEDMMVIVINDVVIVNGPNIYKHKQLPFAKCTDIHRVGHFFGKGEPKLLESIQEELNTIRRMTIDRHHLDLDKSFLVGQTTMLNDTDLISRPHNVIPVDDPKNIKALEYGDIPLSVQQTARSINEDSVRVTGVDDRFQSIQKAPSTATEAAILKESTLKRIKMKLRLLQKGFLTDIARMRVANIMQFYSQPRLERIVGEGGTQDYKNQMARLAQEGLVEVHEGVAYKKSYRQIRLEGKEMVPDEKGNMFQRPINGFSFFEAKPEFFLPTARGGYDVRFEAGATLPISKPLMQSKAQEMFDRLLPVAQSGIYDIEKLSDFLVKANDYNPDDFKSTKTIEDTNITQNRTMMLIQLAESENQMVLQGKPIPPQGTPYASPAHTQVHIAFLRSDVMKQADQQQYDLLVAHIMGEMVAIQARAGGSALQGQQGQGQLPPGQQTNEGQNAVPGLMQGGADVQTGMPLGPAR